MAFFLLLINVNCLHTLKSNFTPIKIADEVFNKNGILGYFSSLAGCIRISRTENQNPTHLF